MRTEPEWLTGCLRSADAAHACSGPRVGGGHSGAGSGLASWSTHPVREGIPVLEQNLTSEIHVRNALTGETFFKM